VNNAIASFEKIHSEAHAILFLFGPHWTKVPPLNLLFLRAFLSQQGFKAAIIDANALFARLLGAPPKQWLSHNKDFEQSLFSQVRCRFPRFIDSLIAAVKNHNAKVIGFSLFSRNRRATFDFVTALNSYTQEKTFVFGGPEVAFEYARKDFFKEISFKNSFFVLGEGELPLSDICNTAYHNLPLSCQTHKGKQLIKDRQIQCLDSLPLFDFEGIDRTLYSSNVAPLFSSRGCIRRCAFCSEWGLFRYFRQHSPASMLKQIKLIQQRYGICIFSFHDSLINGNLAWLKTFCELLIKENLCIQWEAQCAIRPEMETSLFKKMKAAGCYNLFIGLESASDSVLSRMKKGYTSADAEDFFKKLTASGLHFEVSLITGFPQETEKDFRQTLCFIKNNKAIIPKIAQINPFARYSPAQANKQSPQQHARARKRLASLVALCEKEHIKFTRAFINNLTTSHEDTNN